MTEDNNEIRERSSILLYVGSKAEPVKYKNK